LVAALGARAVASVEERIDLGGAERDQAQTVGQELVVQDRGVALELDQIDRHRGHLGSIE